MKKNILAIAILAACIANIALSAIIVLVVVPESKQSTALIKKIVACIDLELENPDASDWATVPLADRQQVTLCEKRTVNLAYGSDSKTHYAQASCYLILNDTSSDYTNVTTVLTNQAEYLSIKLDKLVSAYTAETIKGAEDVIASQMLEELRAYVDSSDCIMDIVVTTLVN